MAAIVDVSGISYFMPILVFFLVALIVFISVNKLGLIKNIWVDVFISILVATIFITAVGARDYVQNIATWFSILVVSGIFLLALMGMFGKFEGFTKGLGIAFAIIGIIIFLVSGMVVYGSYIGPYLPWGDGVGNSTEAGKATSWIYSGRVMGAVLLVVVGAIVAFILSKTKK